MHSFLHGILQQVCVQTGDSWYTSGLYFLGPLLFSLYMNDLPSTINQVDVNPYADDTEISL